MHIFSILVSANNDQKNEKKVNFTYNLDFLDSNKTIGRGAHFSIREYSNSNPYITLRCVKKKIGTATIILTW